MSPEMYTSCVMSSVNLYIRHDIWNIIITIHSEIKVCIFGGCSSEFIHLIIPISRMHIKCI